MFTVQTRRSKHSKETPQGKIPKFGMQPKRFPRVVAVSLRLDSASITQKASTAESRWTTERCYGLTTHAKVGCRGGVGLQLSLDFTPEKREVGSGVWRPTL